MSSKFNPSPPVNWQFNLLMARVVFYTSTRRFAPAFSIIYSMTKLLAPPRQATVCGLDLAPHTMYHAIKHSPNGRYDLRRESVRCTYTTCGTSTLKNLKVYYENFNDGSMQNMGKFENVLAAIPRGKSDCNIAFVELKYALDQLGFEVRGDRRFARICGHQSYR